ncbi:hypothetical protein [Streptomyces niveus]
MGVLRTLAWASRGRRGSSKDSLLSRPWPRRAFGARTAWNGPE